MRSEQLSGSGKSARRRICLGGEGEEEEERLDMSLPRM
jgi:hypothetical protein